MGPGQYLCGCDPETKLRYYSSVDENVVHTSRRYDERGNEVCPEHGEPMYGWRSQIIQTPRGRALDYSRHGTKKKNFKLSPEEVGDRRPHIYEALLDEKARAVLARVHSGGNGHDRSGHTRVSGETWESNFTWTIE